MAYRLGLDVGTASLALVAVSLDAQGQPEKIIYHSGRIFEEPLDPGKKGSGGSRRKPAAAGRGWPAGLSTGAPGG